MTTLIDQILRALHHAENRGGVGAGIYLTRPRSDELLAEMGIPRPENAVLFGEFNRVPIYLDRDVSMVICHDRQGEAYLTFV